MPALILQRRQRLRGTTTLDALFTAKDGSDGIGKALAYPLRAVWRQCDDTKADIAFMVNIPKRRLRHGVDRVQMRRRVREAMRLSMPRPDRADERHIQLALIYVADSVLPYKRVLGAVRRILAALPSISAAIDHEDAAAEDGDK